jgi:hypothetical protein
MTESESGAEAESPSVVEGEWESVPGVRGMEVAAMLSGLSGLCDKLTWCRVVGTVEVWVSLGCCVSGMEAVGVDGGTASAAAGTVVDGDGMSVQRCAGAGSGATVSLSGA